MALISKYDDIFQAYKDYIVENSQYSPRVVKHNTNTTTYFPLIKLVLSDFRNTDETTMDKLEYYDGFYFTIDIYTKDKTSENGKIASQIISDELTRLTIEFFGDKLNMRRTLCRPTPNIDTSVLRMTINYQCLIGNARGNIIRR